MVKGRIFIVEPNITFKKVVTNLYTMNTLTFFLCVCLLLLSYIHRLGVFQSYYKLSLVNEECRFLIPILTNLLIAFIITQEH